MKSVLLIAVGLFFAIGIAVAEDEQRFSISEYRVLGNTVLAGIDIERRLYPMLGDNKSIADVEEARRLLETLYQEQGYGTVFVDIPEQQIDNGVVRLRVTEGRVDRVRITGAQYVSNGQIRQALPALAGDAVPKLPELQAQLAALNGSSRDRSIVPILKAGRMPGTVDVELKVVDELPLHGGLEVNDRYTADTTRWRINASLSYDNLFQRAHSLSLQYQTAPEKREDVEAIVASYVFRIPDWNTTIALYGVDSKTNVAALGTFSVLGTGQVFGLRAIRAMQGSASYFQNIAFGVDYKDFNEDIRLENDQGLKTPIRYVNWSLVYSGTLKGEGDINATGVNLGVNLGLRSVVNDEQQFAEKRTGAKPNYFYLRGSVQRSQQLPATLQLFGKLTGQLADDPLVSNEQLALGGADSVRGYLESAQLGDYGVVGTVELRSDILAKLLKAMPTSTYVFGFYDAGMVRIIDPLPAQTSRFELSSAGVGLRVTDWHSIDLALDWAHALKASGRTNRGDDRTHLSVRYSF